jgi:hypothetical protein
MKMFIEVGLATGYGLDDQEVGVRVSVVYVAHTGSGAHPPSYPMGTGGSFPGGEADHSFLIIFEVKKTWVYTSTPPYVFMV